MWCLKCFHFTQCVTNVQCTECFSLTCVLSDCFHYPKHHSLLQPPIFLSHMPHFQWHLLHVELSGQYSNPKDNANGKCMFSKKAACLQILTLPLNNLSTNFNVLLFHKLNLQSGTCISSQNTVVYLYSKYIGYKYPPKLRGTLI